MTTARQDAWNKDEDLLLAEVVLRHIRDGGTQLSAFEEVGRSLSRTAAACGFRWNSYVRKQYTAAIEIAKEQRKGRKAKGKNLDNEEKENIEIDELQEKQEENREEYQEQAPTSLAFDDVISFLNEQKEKLVDVDRLIKEQEKLKNTIKNLQLENQHLKAETVKYKEKCELIEEDYKSLIEIMERARKMVVLHEDSDQQMRFQMDRNGNLERVNK